MVRGDVYFVDVPQTVGPHLSVIVRERADSAIVIFGQTDGRAGAHVVKPGDPVAKEFGPRLVRATHFHKNNLAVLPVKALPADRLGHIDDHELPPFLKAARPGFIELGRIEDALKAAGHRCQCQGGCKKHSPPCTTQVNFAVGHSLADWRITVRNTVVCRSCWEL